MHQSQQTILVIIKIKKKFCEIDMSLGLFIYLFFHLNWYHIVCLLGEQHKLIKAKSNSVFFFFKFPFHFH